MSDNWYIKLGLILFLKIDQLSHEIVICSISESSIPVIKARNMHVLRSTCFSWKYTYKSKRKPQMDGIVKDSASNVRVNNGSV